MLGIRIPSRGITEHYYFFVCEKKIVTSQINHGTIITLPRPAIFFFIHSKFRSYTLQFRINYKGTVTQYDTIEIFVLTK